jgi:hypothetical protein
VGTTTRAARSAVDKVGRIATPMYTNYHAVYMPQTLGARCSVFTSLPHHFVAAALAAGNVVGSIARHAPLRCPLVAPGATSGVWK